MYLFTLILTLLIKICSTGSELLKITNPKFYKYNTQKKLIRTVGNSLSESLIILASMIPNNPTNKQTQQKKTTAYVLLYPPPIVKRKPRLCFSLVGGGYGFM